MYETQENCYMKNRNYIAVLAVLVMACLVFGNSLFAVPFEPAFKLTKVNGDCTIKTPEGGKFEPPVDGKAYPYGSTVKTGRKSSVVIEFSAGNVCRILASTVLTITEDVKDKKLKTIKLDEGEIGVELEEKFHENNGLSVETAAAICGAIGCKFTVRSTTESDLKVVVIACEDGKLKISGPDFEIPLMEKDDAVSISKATEKDFTRIKNVRGTFGINLKDSQGNPIAEELKTGYSVKIYREVSPSGSNMLVYILILTPEGKTEKTYAYTRPLDAPAAPGTKPAESAKRITEEIGEIKPITTVTTTTTTTTTTTIPLKDRLALSGRIAAATLATITLPPVTTTTPTTTTHHHHHPTPTSVGER
jgi:hypothetical protein